MLTDNPLRPDSPTILDARIDRLRTETQKLSQLLAAPEPGLFTWMQAVADCRREIDAIMDGERD